MVSCSGIHRPPIQHAMGMGVPGTQFPKGTAWCKPADMSDLSDLYVEVHGVEIIVALPLSTHSATYRQSTNSAASNLKFAPWRDFRLRTDDYELLAEAWKAQMTRRASLGDSPSGRLTARQGFEDYALRPFRIWGGLVAAKRLQGAPSGAAVCLGLPPSWSGHSARPFPVTIHVKLPTKLPTA